MLIIFLLVLLIVSIDIVDLFSAVIIRLIIVNFIFLFTPDLVFNLDWHRLIYDG